MDFAQNIAEKYVNNMEIFDFKNMLIDNRQEMTYNDTIKALTVKQIG